jgi:hypothetical protein
MDEMINDILSQQDNRGKKSLKSGPMFSYDKIIEDMFVPEYKKTYSGAISNDYKMADERVIPVLEKLHKKGHDTVASCAGYNYPGHYMAYNEPADPYILFKDDKNIHKLIENTEWEKIKTNPPSEEEYTMQKKFFPFRHKGVSIHLRSTNISDADKHVDNFINNLKSIFSEIPAGEIGVRRGKMFFMNPKNVTQKNINILEKHGVSVNLKGPNNFVLTNPLFHKHELRDNVVGYPRKKALEQWKLLERNMDNL